MENLTKQFNVKLSPQLVEQLNDLVKAMQVETASQVLRRLIKDAHSKYAKSLHTVTDQSNTETIFNAILENK